MQLSAQKLIWERFEVLPWDKQREVADFIEFSASGPDKSSTASSRAKQCWGKERFIGMWDDRSDMAVVRSGFANNGEANGVPSRETFAAR